MAFKRENRNYYKELYSAIEDSAGALRKWLLNHEQSDDFDPMGDAPDTSARRQMIQKAKPGFIQQLDEVIAENAHAGLSYELLDIGTLQEVMFEHSTDVPIAKALNSMLERDGYEFVGRVRDNEGDYQRFYSKTPEKFTYEQNGIVYPNTLEIRAFLRKREDEVGEL